LSAPVEATDVRNHCSTDCFFSLALVRHVCKQSFLSVINC
jgi:hypothetical protein